jgi:hypothetical protein
MRLLILMISLVFLSLLYNAPTGSFSVWTDIYNMGTSIRLVRHWLGQQLLMLVPLVFESDCGVNIPHLNIHDNYQIMISWPTVLRQWIM